MKSENCNRIKVNKLNYDSQVRAELAGLDNELRSR